MNTKLRTSDNYTPQTNKNIENILNRHSKEIIKPSTMLENLSSLIPITMISSSKPP